MQKNLLIDQHDIPDGSGPSVVLVACAKSKCDFSARAEDIYTSSLFQKSRRLAGLLIQSGRADAWRILSAKHGLLGPSKRIDPYNETLKNFGEAKTNQWAAQVTRELPQHLEEESGAVRPEEIVVTILGGRAYREPLLKMWSGSKSARYVPARIHCPFEGMPGNGRMMQWLGQMSGMLEKAMAS